MSVWTAAQDVYTGVPNWPWDNGLVKPIVKSIEVLRCQGGWTASIKGVELGLLAWAYTTLIPEPREIIRKTATGSYKCGFYLGVKFPSPLDIIWKNGDASEVLAQLSRPLVTALFYFWAANTVWDFMGVFSTMFYGAAFCDELPNECTLIGGNGNFIAVTGVVVGYSTAWDPNHWYTGVGGLIQPTAGYLWRAHAYGIIVNRSTHSHDIAGGFGLAQASGSNPLYTASLGPGEATTWHMTYETPSDPPPVFAPACTFKVTGSFEPLEFVEIECTIFTVTAWPANDPIPHKPLPCYVMESPAAHSDGWWIK